MKSYLLDTLVNKYEDAHMTVEQRFEKYYGAKDIPEIHKKQILENMKAAEEDRRYKEYLAEKDAKRRREEHIYHLLYAVGLIIPWVAMMIGFGLYPVLTTIIVVPIILVGLELNHRDNLREAEEYRKELQRKRNE